MKTIAEQYTESIDDDTAEIICPECGKEISQWYNEAYEYLENGQCPFCDCEGVELCDGEDIDEHWYERCDYCKRQQDCRREAAISQLEADEQSNELLRYRCRGY